MPKRHASQFDLPADELWAILTAAAPRATSMHVTHVDPSGRRVQLSVPIGVFSWGQTLHAWVEPSPGGSTLRLLGKSKFIPSLGDIGTIDRLFNELLFHVEAARSQPRAAGWLADPSGRHELRYWDGRAWSEHVSDGGVATTDPL